MAGKKTNWLPGVVSRDRLQRSYLWGGGLALVVLFLVGCGTNSSAPGDATNHSAGTEVVAATPEASLAQHLAATGGTMYGAYWCPHCADQKAMFGDAVDQLPYVECAADGENAQPDLCSAKGIQAYPTWEINGQLYPGVKSLEDLAQLSGYQPAP
ncbi:MAG: glutaredoxin family protein [Spirulina sp.]